MLKHDITGYNVCVTLSTKDFLLFEAIDDFTFKELDKSGAYNITFGHFGSHIFFTANSFYQIDRVKNKIEKLLNKYRNKLEWNGKDYVLKGSKT